MSTKKWRNITDEIFALSKELGFLDTVMHPDITLEETMHAHEINDPKIDPKFDINTTPNINQMIQNGTIKAPQLLTLKDLKNIYTHIFKLQTLVLQGNPLPQTIYTFTYLYHNDLAQKSTLLSPLIESIHTLGSHIFEIHKESCLIKEDDLSFSNFSFKKNVKTHDEVSEIFIKAQKQLDSLIKAEKDASLQLEGKQIQAFMKLRRSLHLFAKSLGLVYDFKNQNKIQSEMKTVRKRLTELQALIKKNNLKQQLPQGVFSLTINKFLRSHFNMRQIKTPTLDQSLSELKNALDQFDLFLPPSTTISQYKYKLDILSYKSINLWSKAYIKYNLFHKESYLFNTIKAEDAFVNDIQQWSHLSQDLKNDEGFVKFIQLATPSLLQNLYRMSSRNSRWFWQISKSYQDLNVMIHLSNELTSKYSEKKKQIHLTNWLYNWGTSIMARQIIWGFQQDLYQISEYHYVTYYLDYILYTNERNNDLFIGNKFDKSILECYYDGTIAKSKQKKKLSEIERIFLSDALFKKGLHYYFRSLNRIMFVLLNRKLIFDPFENSLELKFSNRFRIFKNALFIRKLTYQTYKQQLENVSKDQSRFIDQAMDLLKKSKTIFGLFHQFQDNETFINQKGDAQILEKLSIKLSLVVMALKMKQNKKFIIRKDHPRYPQIQIQ